MSPELLDADLQGTRRTKYSDRYALGMVIYEVLSGRIPFYQHGNWTIPLKVAKGDHPERPQGAEGVWFTDSVWMVLERCWVAQPKNRPSIEDILQCLSQASRSWTRPPLPQVAVPPTANSPTTNPFDITDERSMWVDEGEVSSTSHSLDDHDLPSKDDTDDNEIYPPVYKLPASHHDDLHHSVSSAQSPDSAEVSSSPLPNDTRFPGVEPFASVVYSSDPWSSSELGITTLPPAGWSLS